MNAKLGELLAMTLPPMGYELVDWEMSRGRMVRVFIDKLAVESGLETQLETQLETKAGGETATAGVAGVAK